MIQILIIDDHPLVIDGVRTMLNNDAVFAVASACKTGAEGIEYLRQHKEIDVVLLDINLPDMDGLRICEQIRTFNREVKIIGLTYLNEAGIITQLIRKGANGYLLKNMEREELVLAMNRVLDGDVYLSREANEKILQSLHGQSTRYNDLPALTRREKEILGLLAEGLTSNDIASRLYLSSHTIDTHRKNMLQKYGVKNTASLMKIVRENGLLEQ